MGADGRGGRCCEPIAYPDVARERAVGFAAVAKALGDPIRMQLVDVLRRDPGKVCICALEPLFEISQPTLSHHLKKLRGVELVHCERDGVCAYYDVVPAALDGLGGWLR